MYLLLICIVSVPIWLITSSCTFLLLAGSAKLMLPMQLCSTILTLPKYSASASCFWACYIYCNKSLVFAGATCMKLPWFSLIFSGPKLIKLLGILGLLFLWFKDICDLWFYFYWTLAKILAGWVVDTWRKWTQCGGCTC